MWRPGMQRLFFFGVLLVGAGLGNGSRADDEAVSPEPAIPAIMAEAKAAELRRLFPQVADPDVRKLLDDPRLLLYTEAEMPRCYQDWDGALYGVHSAFYNISAESSEPYGNGNREFPWGSPGGTHRAAGVTSFRFLWLPVDEQGRTRPVAYFRRHFRGDRYQGYAWMFPVGTVVGEVLLLDRPDGGRVTFELRLRRRHDTVWEVDVLRPFPRAEELVQRIRELRPDWEAHADLKQVVAHLTETSDLPVGHLYTSHPARRAFGQKAGIDTLPPIDDDNLVVELLTQTPFRSAQGEEWRRDVDGTRTAAPTTADRFHIVPAQYDAGFIDVDRNSCMRCHDTVGLHVRRFQPGRDWYGRVRGSDGIFSFHPFSLGSVSRNGYSRGVRLRGELVESGWLAGYDPAKHPESHYRLIPGLGE